METWVAREAEIYLQQGKCSLDMSVVYSQSFGMVENKSAWADVVPPKKGTSASDSCIGPM